MLYYDGQNELYHFGIKGMKWGVRRYQNEDGSLTEAGKKRISKQYKKASVKTMKTLNKRYSGMQFDAYNKTADYMNEGGLDKFNQSQHKKYGDSFGTRDGYLSDYEEAFNDKMREFLSQSLVSFYESDKNYQKGKTLVDKYGMTSWDELARSNEDVIAGLRNFGAK